MPQIQRLSQQVINQIAAGEVIERPASVVKELMENSVDAGATRIDVEIGRGGAELIRITDNGCGIALDQLPLAVASHATSKLATADDLFHVHTMGFRGEAVASIAEVSHLKIRSKAAGAESGGEITVTAGQASDPRAVGAPAGTQFEIRELFVSVPVRRKFLKRESTEFGHIAEQFLRIALAHPNLHLTLRHNDKGVHELPPGTLLDRLRSLHGALADELIPIEATAGRSRLWGYVAPPRVSKTSRKSQHLFLNGRAIGDRSLQHALTEAYRGLLMVGRQPVTFLFLEVPPEDVDVNVHPTKSEVRFLDSSSLYRLVLQTLRAKFLSMDLPTAMDGGGLKASSPAAQQLDLPATDQLEAHQDLAAWAKRALESASAEIAARPRDERPSEVARQLEQAAAAYEPNTTVTTNGESTIGSHDSATLTADEIAPPEGASARDEAADRQDAAPTAAEVAARMHRDAGESTRVLQVHDTYLVFETGDGLTVIDQHALHERVMYEQLRPRVLAGRVEIQKLLIPVPVELSAEDAALLADHVELAQDLGLEIEAFGGTTVLVSGYPTLLAKADPAELLQTVADCVRQADRKTTRRDLLDSLMHSMSCKAAIKAGQRLAPEEIDALMALRHLVDDAHHCPHGRPTALTLSREELDRQFGRLG